MLWKANTVTSRSLLYSSCSCSIKLFELALSFGNELHPSFQTCSGLAIQLKDSSQNTISGVSVNGVEGSGYTTLFLEQTLYPYMCKFANEHDSSEF